MPVDGMAVWNDSVAHMCGTMILYGTSYQLPPACSFEYTEIDGQKLPSSMTW
jgi:hypothetical protein